MKKGIICAVFVWSSLVCSAYSPKPGSITKLIRDFAAAYQKLTLPAFSYSYIDYFNSVPSLDALSCQRQFFLDQQRTLRPLQKARLSLQERIGRDHLQYEIDVNLQRIALEMAWVSDGRRIPLTGLYTLKNHEAWYQFFIQRYTSLPLTAEAITTLGQREVTRVHKEINRIQHQTGYTDSAAFYAYLKTDFFLLKNKQQVISAFALTDSLIRQHLPAFVGSVAIPAVYAMEWPNADASTPPGIYLNAHYNPYGKDIFQYNFYGGYYNRRAIEWLYMHEAIPGHHLQATLRAAQNRGDLQKLFTYPGNFEGWACYVENYGKALGMYTDVYSELGKWEWDLVRSARLLLDTGIHRYGWNRQQALTYWQQAVPGQQEIADREINRVTNWPSQALSYKVGADFLEQLRQQLKAKYGPRFNQRRFHSTYLSFGMCPLAVIKQNFEAAYAANSHP